MCAWSGLRSRATCWSPLRPVAAPRDSTLIGGHVESASEGVGVLGALREIDIGNRVVVTDAFGVQHGYRVAARRLYPKYSLPGTYFRSPDGLGSS
jgi:hypothetical protein